MGTERETPLYYLDDGADVVVVASKGGTETHPAWFHNLMAMPETEVEFVGERRRVRPRLADAEERARLWPRLVELYSPYEEYQTFTSREIPVVVLEPVGSRAGAHALHARASREEHLTRHRRTCRPQIVSGDPVTGADHAT